MALLSVRDVTLRFGGIVALDGVSFDVVVDGALVFSKQAKGRFPEDGEDLALLAP